MLVVGEASQNGTRDIVAYRGSVTAGLGGQEVLDNRGATATLRGAWSNRSGNAVVMWNQNNGTADTRYAATLDSFTGAWSLAELNKADESIDQFEPFHAMVTDNGDFVLYRNGWRVQRKAGAWSNYQAFDAWDYWNYIYSTVALNSDGSALVVQKGSLAASGNAWAALDGPSQTMVQSFPTGNSGSGYLMGVPARTQGFALLSKSGIGVYITGNSFDTLPSPAMPAGDGRAVANLWAFYFK